VFGGITHETNNDALLRERYGWLAKNFVCFVLTWFLFFNLSRSAIFCRIAKAVAFKLMYLSLRKAVGDPRHNTPISLLAGVIIFSKELALCKDEALVDLSCFNQLKPFLEYPVFELY
jgi:hypothetical protein